MANYVSSDWHGAQWAWRLTQEFLGPDDKLYYLGDSTDRGSGLNGDGGWSMLKEMLQDDRIIYIQGNHDEMLANAISYPNSYREVTLCIRNGGQNTLNVAVTDPEAKAIVKKIRELPLYVEYIRPDGKKVFMSHSGSTNLLSPWDLLWDRAEYFTSQNWTEYDYILHGHTRARHIIKDLKEVNKFYGEERYTIPAYNGGAYWYNDYRCTIDCGTILSDQIVLINLDTFEEEIFNSPSCAIETH